MITQWLDATALANLGEMLYFVALLSSLAIAVRMWGIYKRWNMEVAANLMAVSLLLSAYWLYVIIRIHLGCSFAGAIIGDLACMELTFWSRLIVSVCTACIAISVWRHR
jgi:hypothetical protein